MDPLANPFSMGAGNPPPALTGRATELGQFWRLLGRLSAGKHEQSIVLWGLRGVGKTVLLLECQAIAEREFDWIAPPPIEIKSDTDFRAELADLTFQALKSLSVRRKVGDRLRRFGGLLKGFKLATTAAGDVTFSFDPADADAIAATGNLERDLTALLVEVGEVAREHDAGIVYLIDEMQFLGKGDMEALAAAMHRMSQLGLPVALVGAGLPQLPGLLVDAKSYAERLFSYLRLDRLDAPAARAALELPVEGQGAAFADAPDPLAELVRLSGSYPAFIQAYGKGVWDEASGPTITLADVERAAPGVRARLDAEFFHTRFAKATSAEQRYMAAIASLGDGPQSSSAAAAQLGSTTSKQSVFRDGLIKKGLIYSPRYGEIDFTVPQFADYVRRCESLMP